MNSRTGNTEISRRSLLALLLFSGAGGAATARTTGGYRVWERRYRAHAVVLLCGLPVFSKSDVGGGYAVVEERSKGDLTTVALQFAGGSWPGKAHGLNRLGFIQETVAEKPSGDPVDAQYFGFMTTSREKSFEQAKKSFTDSAGSTVPYMATVGKAKSGQFVSTRYGMDFASSLTWKDCSQLVRDVRSGLGHASGTKDEPVSYKPEEMPNTFLNSVRQALLNPAEQTRGTLIYNGKLYRLETEKLAQRLNGTLLELATGQRSHFRLWYEKESDSFLPVRIEYRAKSFLKLIFEHDPDVHEPQTTLFLNKESA